MTWEPEMEARAKATPLTTENTAEWLAVAHVRGYCHLSTLCPICQIEDRHNQREREAAMQRHPSTRGRR